ncbi:MAG: hypothetical protein ACFFDN_13510, partial [Candidatus Hodarchaeota archaeon]
INFVISPPQLGQYLKFEFLDSLLVDSSIEFFTRSTLLLGLFLKEKGKKQTIGIMKKKSTINDRTKKIINNAMKIRFKKRGCFIFVLNYKII